MESETVQVPHFTHEFSLTGKKEDTKENVSESAPYSDEEKQVIDAINESFRFIKEAAGVITYRRKSIEYTIKNLRLGQLIDLRIVLKISDITSSGRYLASVNLLNDREKFRFAQMAREKLDISEQEVISDLETLTVELEERQEGAYMKQQGEVENITRSPYIILLNDKTKAMDCLANRDYLTETLLHDLEHMGVIGEERNKQIMLCAGISRHDSNPMHILMVSSPGTGKSFTQRSVLELFPPCDVLRISRTTNQVLFYVEKGFLNRLILSLDEVSGAGEFLYPFRTMMSEHRLDLLGTGKDETGNHRAFRRVVDAICSVFMATTDINQADAETRSRMVVLYGDESEEQTRRIMEAQLFFSGTKDGRVRRGVIPGIIKKHQDMLYLITGVPVEYHDQAVYEHVKKRQKFLSERRNFPCFLTLLNSIARSRMFQRSLVDGCITITGADVELGERLTNDLFAAQRTALSGPLKMFYGQIVKYVDIHRKNLLRTEYDFTSREIREFTGLGDTQVYKNLKKLVWLEYISKKGANGVQCKYRLLDE